MQEVKWIRALKYRQGNCGRSTSVITSGDIQSEPGSDTLQRRDGGMNLHYAEYHYRFIFQLL